MPRDLAILKACNQYSIRGIYGDHDGSRRMYALNHPPPLRKELREGVDHFQYSQRQARNVFRLQDFDARFSAGGKNHRIPKRHAVGKVQLSAVLKRACAWKNQGEESLEF